MADADVPITAGSGTKIDTRTVGAGTDEHRQVVVLGDPTTAADVAGVKNGGLAVNGGTLVSTSGAIAAAGTGTIGPLNVATSANVTFTVKNTVAGSAWAGAPVLVFEQSDDNTSWGPLPVVRSDTGQPGSTFTLGAGLASSELNFDAALEGISFVRCRVTTGPATNGLTVVIAAGGMPFIQGSSVLAAPVDGHKFTYISAPQSTLVPHVVGTAAFLEMSNIAVTLPRLIRVLRVRLEMTLATAAMLSPYLLKKTAVSTGGTSTTQSGQPTDISDVAAGIAGVVKHYTVAPTTGGTSLAGLGTRRTWVGVATAAGAPGVAEWTFGNRPGARAVTLRPGEVLGAWWNTNPATAVALGFEIEWTEEPV